jgi:predicted dehydrogenase
VTKRRTVLIAGLGNIGSGYDEFLDPDVNVYSHARAFSQEKRFRLIAGVDPSESRRRSFGQMYDCQTFVDLDQALEEMQPDVVVVAAPTRLHYHCVRRTLEQCRPQVILCEKPLAYEISEARAIVEDCETWGTKLYVNYMRRSDPGVIEVRRRITAGELGESIKGIAWYSKGLVHNGSHFVNLLEYWLGGVQSFAVLDRGRLWDGVDPEPDLHITFERGVILLLSAWEEAFSHYGIELLSSNGRLRYEQGGQSIQWNPVGTDPEFRGYATLAPTAEIIDNGMKRYQAHVVAQLARDLEGKDAYLCSGSDALRTLETINQMIERTRL